MTVRSACPKHQRRQVAKVAPSNPVRSEKVRPGALARWFRKHPRVLVMVLWLFTVALPLVAVLVLPSKAQSIITYLFASVPISLVITWRMTDRRKHD
jgi:hypothetical protein